MNWAKFGLGLSVAMATSGLQYAQVLPPPWGPLMTFAGVLLANFMQSPRGAGPDA